MLSLGAGLSLASGVKHNLTATTAPTTSNDISEEYSVGSFWADLNNDKSYVCLDNSTGAAVWVQTGGTGSGGISNVVEDTTPQLGGDLDLNGKNLDFPSTANISDCLDEDTMSSNSATALATQQSIKAYVDSQAGGSSFSGCVLRHNANDAISASPAALPWNTEISDTGSYHDTVTNNSRITVPAGVSHMQFFACVTCEPKNPAGAGDFRIFLYKNGADLSNAGYTANEAHFGASAGSRQPSLVIASPVLAVSQSDYFELFASQGISGLSRYGNYSFFCGVKID